MNISIVQIIVLALLQGVTELFPISSLGHTVIVPALLGWGNVNGNENFVPLVVALHLGTAIALIFYFWRDWLQVIRTLLNSARTRKVRTGTDEWVSWLLIIGSIPTGLLGLFLKKPLEHLFATPIISATFLVVNGSILFASELLRRSKETNAESLSPKERETRFRPLSSLGWKEALFIGLTQSLALIPGISRSGTTMAGGMVARLSHEDAARFSFLLGTPIIFAAALIEVPKLFHESTAMLLLVFFGMVLSGVAAYLSTKFLMRYFEGGRLFPFAYYCWAVGLISIGLMLFVFHIGA